jgi:two-component system sensor histidine kinase/response regulator
MMMRDMHTVSARAGNGTAAATDEPGAAAGGQAPSRKSPPAPLGRILIAEDNIVNQQVAVRMIERLGYRADVVANGLEVVAAVAQMEYAAVLMDCQMPEIDGFQATAIIRSREHAEQRHIPIIAMTAKTMITDRERCFAVGMDAYLPKPVFFKDLAAVLRRWVAPRPTPLASPGPREF